MCAYILSSLQTDPILAAMRAGETHVSTSLDLGLSAVRLSIGSAGLTLPDGGVVTAEDLGRISRREGNCFVVSDEGAQPIYRFNDALNRGYTLRATSGAPTLLISGFPMHRTKGITPDEDTRKKVAAAGPLGGNVLDTTTGLGYLTIEAVKAGARVTTIELDPLVLEVARYNPWSAVLFSDPRVEQRVGNSFDVIKDVASGSVDTILHDPPTMSLAGELYSEEFYREALRVLTRQGKLFHYIGDLKSRFGQSVSKGVIRRLQDAGFRRVTPHADAFAVMAYK